MKKFFIIILLLSFYSAGYAAEQETKKYVVSTSEYGVLMNKFINITSLKAGNKCQIKLNNDVLFEETCEKEADIKLLYYSALSVKNGINYFVFQNKNAKLIVVELVENGIHNLSFKNMASISWNSNSIPEIKTDNEKDLLTINKLDKSKIIEQYQYKNGKVNKIK